MIIYFLILISILSCILLYIFNKKAEYWTYLIILIGSILCIIIGKYIAVSNLTSDTEYWGSYVTEVRYYEDWNEYIHRTCTRSYACGKDSKGNTEYCTETYDCSYVDYHPEHWIAIDNTNQSFSITKNEYQKLCNKFQSKITFVDLNRKYYTDDGDMYHCFWTGTEQTLEDITTVHTYENRPQASHGIYHYDPIDSFDIKQYSLYNYPKLNPRWNQNCLLGSNDAEAIQKLKVLNAKLGSKKQVRCYILLFDSNDRTTGLKQEQYWQGGNKNEFNVAIGLDSDKKVKWAHIFSWSESHDLKIHVRNHLQETDSLNLVETIKWLESELEHGFVRKQFKDFSYLTIDPTFKQIVIISIVLLIINAILFYVFAFKFHY